MTTLTHNQADHTGTSVLAIGLVVSLGFHVLVGSAAVFSLQSRSVSASGGELVIEQAQPPSPPEIDLGIEESKVASIAWLGVEDQELKGIAEPSTVEQAALSTNPGDASVPAESAQTPPPIPEQMQAQAPQEPQPEAEPIEETSPTEPVTLPPPPALEITPSPTPKTEIVEPAPEQEQSEPQAEQSAKPEQAPTETAPEPEPKREPTEPQPELISPPTPTPTQLTSPGLPGELARREAVATAIREADDVVYDKMNRPLSAHGLEIQPKAPQYPLSVRNAALPSNAIVLIRFDRAGKVRSADFLVSADGKKRYDTGQREVDAPLMAAIYQWTAKGKPLLELDPLDPDATFEVPMRILFSKPRYEKTGE